MANTYTGTSSQWMSSNKAYEELLSETEKYKNYFLEPVTEYSQEVASATQAANYDISQAYANYKKQQLSLLSNKALATGFKEDVSSDLKSAYESSRYKTESELSSQIDVLGQKYEKELQNRYGIMSEEAKKLSQIERGLYEYLGVQESDLENLGYYKQGELDEYGRPVYEITDEGRALLEEGMYGADRIGEKSYYNYLRENYGDDLADYYLENQGTINELIAGLPSEQRNVSGKYTPQTENVISYKKLMHDHQKEAPETVDVLRDWKPNWWWGDRGFTFTDKDGNKVEIKNEDIQDAYLYGASDYLNNLDDKGNYQRGDIVVYDGRAYVKYNNHDWITFDKLSEYMRDTSNVKSYKNLAKETQTLKSQREENRRNATVKERIEENKKPYYARYVNNQKK